MNLNPSAMTTKDFAKTALLGVSYFNCLANLILVSPQPQYSKQTRRLKRKSEIKEESCSKTFFVNQVKLGSNRN